MKVKGKYRGCIQVNTGSDEEPEWTTFAFTQPKEYDTEEEALNDIGDSLQDIPIVTYLERLTGGENV